MRVGFGLIASLIIFATGCSSSNSPASVYGEFRDAVQKRNGEAAWALHSVRGANQYDALLQPLLKEQKLTAYAASVLAVPPEKFGAFSSKDFYITAINRADLAIQRGFPYAVHNVVGTLGAVTLIGDDKASAPLRLANSSEMREVDFLREDGKWKIHSVRDPKKTPVARWDDPQAIATSGMR
jgi:hypothetical protein